MNDVPNTAQKSRARWDALPVRALSNTVYCGSYLALTVKLTDNHNVYPEYTVSMYELLPLSHFLHFSSKSRQSSNARSEEVA